MRVRIGNWTIRHNPNHTLAWDARTEKMNTGICFRSLHDAMAYFLR